MPWRTEQDRFVLDVEPEKLRDAARKVASVGREFDDRGTRIAGEPAKIGDSWTGKAARTTKREIRGLAGRLEKFVDGLEGTREAVLQLARRYETELETVEGLNERWREADDDYDAALGRAEDAYGERASDEDAPAGSPLRMLLDPTYISAKSDAEAARKATRDRLQRRFDDVQADLRTATRTCATRVSKRVPLPVEPSLVDRYRADGYVGLQHHRSGFTSDMPLSRAATKGPEVCEVPEADGDDVPLVDGWDAADLVRTWVEGNAAWYEEALREGDQVVQAAKVAKFLKRIGFIGTVVTVAGAGNDIRKGHSPTKVVLTTAAVVVTGAVVVLTAPVSVPAGLVIGASAVVATGAGWAADKFFETERGKRVVAAVDKGVVKVADAVADKTESVWRAIF